MNRLPILIYHAIDTDHEPAIVEHKGDLVYVVRLDVFELQMEYLQGNGYHVLSLDDYVASLGASRVLGTAGSSLFQRLERISGCRVQKRGESPAVMQQSCKAEKGRGKVQSNPPEKSVIITFDDGHVTNYMRALPVLQRYGFGATFFITVKNIDSHNGLKCEELREMADSGMSIQSHTMTHPYLSELSVGEVSWELRESKSILEGELGRPVDLLALPGGRRNSTVRDVAMKTGYKAMCTSEVGYNSLNSDPYSLKRWAVKRDMGLSDFISIIEMRHSAVAYHKARCFMLGGMKRMLGNRRYDAIREKLL